MGKIEAINISYPNLVSVCVDQCNDGEISGRIYQYYTEKPWEFSNVVQLLRQLESFYDQIAFPQSSTESRHFREKPHYQQKPWKRIRDPEEVLEQRGERQTFVICVKYRQNATWQGEAVWMETKERTEFHSSLELIKILDNVLQ